VKQLQKSYLSGEQQALSGVSAIIFLLRD